MSDSSAWHAFEGGASIGQRGSEEGVFVEDQEHAGGARISLERDTRVAPFAITCGVYGWFFHTRYFSTEEEARREFEAMKVELELIMDLLSGPASQGDQTESAVLQAISRFVDRFPT